VYVLSSIIQGSYKYVCYKQPGIREEDERLLVSSYLSLLKEKRKNMKFPRGRKIAFVRARISAGRSFSPR
jgi:hypothetical protein